MDLVERKSVYRGKKIRLLPTREQEELFWKSAGVARWAYNYFLAENERAYKEWLEKGKEGKSYISEGDVRKHITALKKTTHIWLKDVGSNVVKQAVKDASIGLQRYFNKIAQKPKFRSKKKSKISFYVNYESLVRKPNGFHGEKIGYVKTASPLPKIPKGTKYKCPYISYDGKYWFLSLVCEVEVKEVELTNESLGIDLGIKELAVVSNKDGSIVRVYKNINKTAKMKKLGKRLVREKRKASRRLEANIKGYKKNRSPIWATSLDKCKNYQKQNKKIRRIYKRMTDIRNNHLHQATSEIVKIKPSRIVMEDLNVADMMRNKYVAKAIAEQRFSEFKRQIKYKAEMYGIEVVEADRFFASSKTCNHCGYVKKDMRLDNRVYICPSCGMRTDRDLNAAINLANYNVT